MNEKILWVVNYDDVGKFLDAALSIGATGVAIRTDNDLASAIPRFHAKSIKVFGWRWPSAMRDAAMKEAMKVSDLLQKGMDGYYVDPEGEPGKPYDWNQSGLSTLAADFCKQVRKNLGDKAFGVTSHYRAQQIFGKLPWAAFFSQATVLLPQAYWRVTGGVVGHGIPSDNYGRAIDFWTASGGAANLIVPMAGELEMVTGAEVDQYVQAAAGRGITELHFYAWSSKVKKDVMDAISRA